MRAHPGRRLRGREEDLPLEGQERVGGKRARAQKVVLRVARTGAARITATGKAVRMQQPPAGSRAGDDRGAGGHAGGRHGPLPLDDADVPGEGQARDPPVPLSVGRWSHPADRLRCKFHRQRSMEGFGGDRHGSTSGGTVPGDARGGVRDVRRARRRDLHVALHAEDHRAGGLRLRLDPRRRRRRRRLRQAGHRRRESRDRRTTARSSRRPRSAAGTRRTTPASPTTGATSGPAGSTTARSASSTSPPTRRNRSW